MLYSMRIYQHFIELWSLIGQSKRHLWGTSHDLYIIIIIIIIIIFFIFSFNVPCSSTSMLLKTILSNKLTLSNQYDYKRWFNIIYLLDEFARYNLCDKCEGENEVSLVQNYVYINNLYKERPKGAHPHLTPVNIAKHCKTHVNVLQNSKKQIYFSHWQTGLAAPHHVTSLLEYFLFTQPLVHLLAWPEASPRQPCISCQPWSLTSPASPTSLKISLALNLRLLVNLFLSPSFVYWAFLILLRSLKMLTDNSPLLSLT